MPVHAADEKQVLPSDGLVDGRVDEAPMREIGDSGGWRLSSPWRPGFVVARVCVAARIATCVRKWLVAL